MRLFVAVWPPDDVLDAVALLDRPAIEGVRWTTRDQWHVTLRFLGSVEEDEVARLCDALDDVGRAHPSARVELGPATSCFGRGVLHVPTSGLAPVAAATVRATDGVGSEPPDPRPFAGHLTLARSRGRTDLRPLAGAPIAASWTASELTLVRSHTARTGARYEVLHRSPLLA